MQNQLQRPDGATVRQVGDPALRLWFDDRETRAVAVEGAIHTFVVPPRFQSARIVSRIGHSTSPESEEERQVGVAIGRIVLRHAGRLREIPLDHPALGQGFHACERYACATWRWSDGNAYLPASLLALDGRPAMLVEIHIHDKLSTYPAEAAGDAAE